MEQLSDRSVGLSGRLAGIPSVFTIPRLKKIPASIDSGLGMYIPLMPVPDFTAFVLAGGRSTRMGMDKAFVVFEGRTLLARALDLLRSLTSDVRIVGDPAKFTSFASVVEDLFPGCGPLAGIHAALRSSETDLNLIVAVDIPFLSSVLLRYLLKRAADSDEAVVTAPRTARGWQALCAIYRRDFAPIAEKALHAGAYKIDALFAEAGVQAISELELQSAGFPADVFSNLNTPDDLAEAIRKQR